MTREEHLQWCKGRALKYLDEGDMSNAVASMLSDLGKHEETRGVGQTMAPMGMMFLMQQDRDGVRKFITGFR
jgi:hypothetical protein